MMFECEICKRAPAKNARKYRWKTEKGFLGHYCYTEEQVAIAEEKKRREERQALQMRENEAILAQWQQEAKYKPGDRLWLVYYWVTAPTHVANQWGRMVKVRYEEAREYCTQMVTIKAIVYGGYALEERKDVQQERNLFVTYAEAQDKRSEREARYNASVQQAQEYR